jgi:hypothetical protein
MSSASEYREQVEHYIAHRKCFITSALNLQTFFQSFGLARGDALPVTTARTTRRGTSRMHASPCSCGFQACRCVSPSPSKRANGGGTGRATPCKIFSQRVRKGPPRVDSQALAAALRSRDPAPRNAFWVRFGTAGGSKATQAVAAGEGSSGIRERARLPVREVCAPPDESGLGRVGSSASRCFRGRPWSPAPRCPAAGNRFAFGPKTR